MSSSVSIIMPAYNAGRFLADAIDSVLTQTYTDWELIIADDGSTDNTALIAKSFCNSDTRIKYFHQENGRQGKARNFALSHCNGAYIGFLDADDLWLPHKLELQLMQLKDKQVDLVFSDCKVFTENLSDSKHLLNITPGIFHGDKALHFFLEQNKIPILTVLMKADILRKVGGFTEKESIQNAEDYHLWLRLLINGYIFYGYDLALAAYRDHSHATTNADKLAIRNVIEALYDIKNSYHHKKLLFNSYLKRWFKKFQAQLNNPGLIEYRRIIKYNCTYTDQLYYNFFFQISLNLFGFKITRRLINKIING